MVDPTVDPTPREKAHALIAGGICDDWDEAVHFLVDSGEITSSEHEELLSPDEKERVYGSADLGNGQRCMPSS
jgi:hypothetical protein